MKLSALAARQKRLKFWNTFVKEQVQDKTLRLTYVDQLKLYRNLLARCWEHGQITQADERELDDLERRIEDLNEQARQTVVPTRTTR